MHVLYIIMRTDLESMNPGKAMAQASHASNAFVHEAEKLARYSKYATEQLEEWRGETQQGFGTVLVLGGSMNDIEDTATMLEKGEYICGVVHDPTYPIKDGDVTHFIPLNTCAYVFVPNKEDDPLARVLLSRFDLHP